MRNFGRWCKWVLFYQGDELCMRVAWGDYAADPGGVIANALEAGCDGWRREAVRCV